MDYSTNNDLASDTESPVPGNSVADQFAQKEIFVNDVAMNMDNANNEMTICVPLESDALCPFCVREGLRFTFNTLKSLNEHINSHHLENKISWCCRFCLKNYSKLHGWYCHYGKCKGSVDTGPPKAFQCELCNDRFDTQRGLSTHERHDHPRLRNEKRHATSTSRDTTQVRNRPRGAIWTTEETDLLKILELRFRNFKQINAEIAKIITSKTAKQISDKRRDLRKTAESGIGKVRVGDETENDNNNNDILNTETEVGNQEKIKMNREEAHRRSLENEGERKEKMVKEDEMEEGDAVLSEGWLTKSIDEANSPGNMTQLVIEIYNTIRMLWRNYIQGTVELRSGIDSFIEDVLVPFLNKTNETATISNKEKGNQNCSGKENGRKQQQFKNSFNKRLNKNNRSHRKRFSYVICQNMFRECPKRLADIAVKGDLNSLQLLQTPPSGHEIKNLYEALWGTLGPNLEIENDNQINEINISRILTPVTPEEVRTKINKTSQKSAAGLDGLRKKHLQQKGLEVVLALLYNIILVTSYYPKPWKLNRATLIPMYGQNLASVKNWRPITVSSLLSRIFSALVDIRLRKITEQDIRKKYFTSENDCKSNVMLLNEAIKLSKVLDGGIVSVLDISEAFDTIPHTAITRSMAKKGIPAGICDLIENMYTDVVTYIKASNSQVEIHVKRGLKQGDPLSSLLLNFCIGLLSEDLQKKTLGLKVNAESNSRIAILAFANNIVLLGANRSEAQSQLDLTHEYLRKLGIVVCIPKCLTFEIRTSRDTWYMVDPDLSIQGNKISAADPDTVFKYLDVKIEPWRGLTGGIIVPDIIDIVKRVRKMPLKPQQKVELIASYIMPRFIHGFLICPPSDSVLRFLDSELRQQIKLILHLVPSTASGFFYAAKSNGGLGLPRYEHVIKLSVLRNAVRMTESADPAISKLCLNSAECKKLERMAHSLRINWPTSLKDIEKAKRRLKKENWEDWNSLKSQGQGASAFYQDKIGNCWLKEHDLLKPSRFTGAIKLRTNTYGNRVTLARANKNMDIRCRRCHSRPETLGHILGFCGSTKPKRIKRHDDIKNLLAERLATRESNAVFVEPQLQVGENLIKPDIVIKNEDKLIVVDVTIRFENRENLLQACNEKIKKYGKCLAELKKKYKCKEGGILPVVIGCRGAIPSFTKKNLQELKISIKDMKTMSLMVLRSSLEIANAFLDYDT